MSDRRPQRPSRAARLAAFGIGAAVVTLLVSACSGDPVEPPQASGDPVPVPTVTVTATVTAEPEPQEEAPDFGFTFFEQAEIGQTFAQAGQALGMPVIGMDACPHYGAIWLTDIATTYAFTNASNPGSGITFFYTNAFLGSPGDPWPRNAEGVGIGSTQAEILAAYPGATTAVVSDLGAGDITVVTVEDPDSDSKYVFGFYAGSSTADLLQWGPGAGVQWSHLCGGF